MGSPRSILRAKAFLVALRHLEDMPITFGQVLKEEEGTVLEPILQKTVANFSIRAPLMVMVVRNGLP